MENKGFKVVSGKINIPDSLTIHYINPGVKSTVVSKYTLKHKEEKEVPRHAGRQTLDPEKVYKALLKGKNNKVSGTFLNIFKKFKKVPTHKISKSVFFEKIYALPTVLCSKCSYKSDCPYYNEEFACSFATSPLFLPRDLRFTERWILMYMNRQLWTTAVFTNRASFLDNFVIFYATYILARIQADKELPDAKIKKYKGKKYQESKYRVSLQEGKINIGNKYSNQSNYFIKTKLDKRENRKSLLGFKSGEKHAQ